jgi:hydrogenase 3 maturation protease
MKRMLLGVGNRLSRDDGAGPVLAERLAGSDWTAIDCGTSLENVGGIVARERPDLLVIADAARMGLGPGAVRRLPRPSVDRMLATTHGLPLKFFLDRLASVASEVVLLGIEPADLSLGEGLSTEVERAVGRLAEALAAGGRRGVASVRFLEAGAAAERTGTAP